MKTVCVYLFIVLVVACDPTKTGSVRIRRQEGWSWETEGDVKPPLPSSTTTTIRPDTGVTPNAVELRECIKNCPATSQYNPVCATNNVTYDNEGKMKCAKSCGAGDIKVRFMGTCSAL